MCLNAGAMGRRDAETETLIPTTGAVFDVAHAIQAGALRENPNSGPDGVGGQEGIAYTLEARREVQATAYRTSPNCGAWETGDRVDALTTGTDQTSHIIAFSSKDYGNDAQDGLSPTLRSMGHDGSHANGGGQVAVAYANAGHFGSMKEVDASDPLRSGGGDTGHGGESIVVESFTIMERGRKEGSNLEYRQDGTSNAILTPNGGRGGLGVGAIAAEWAVRRLTPTECERLQGFPDNWTKIAWRKKPEADCPDGPRYKAVGNSMAVNVMRFIGERIAEVDQIA